MALKVIGRILGGQVSHWLPDMIAIVKLPSSKWYASENQLQGSNGRREVCLSWLWTYQLISLYSRQEAELGGCLVLPDPAELLLCFCLYCIALFGL